MPVETRIHLEGSALKAFAKGHVGRAVARAFRKAASTSARDMRSEAIKVVRESKRIKAKAVRKALVLHKNKGRKIEDMEWGVDVRGGVTRLSDYPMRQTKKGVSVEIDRGHRKVIKSAFVATLKTGHKGAFMRKGKERLPIKELVATRPIGVLRQAAESARVLRRGRSSFERTFDRVMPMEMEKVSR